ncbi:DUF2189 domain-containing protein [Sinirhodobacter sp. WL0062]|uniref:DUF2189 domain-containing protein n=1 Tax=Rhodobacter flavimaris TaxID=2907145 RepID=A0ABS8YST1_9RHOB|nr:DUF2189 domain-containing protein [Sinirhodobacter sp. WL0062]MCE5972929.1 DUF2189 domain-containing protein [Sinirhodobacter sp. WL0062]
MTHIEDGGPSALPEIRDMPVALIPDVLRAGLRDFLRAPAFGIFFSAVYVLGGIVLWLVFSMNGREWWLVPFFLGFPLLAPFAAIGLYEVSRRIEAGEPLIWPAVLGVIFAQKDRQLPSMAVVILLLFMFWMFIAHMTFAMFLGLQAMTNVSTDPLGVLLSGNGPAMLLFGTVVGGAFALVLFAFTVVGLPLLLEREVDFISAIIVSVQAVAANPASMLIWAGAIAGLLFVGMLPLFLGLFIVLPVLGHASWHMYRHLTV